MIIYSTVITQPVSEPVTLDQVKAQLKIDGDDEDNLLTSKIKAARRICENYTGLSFLTQIREINLDWFPCGIIEIPNGPVQTIDEFTYIDSDGVSQPLAEDTDFRVDIKSGITRISVINSWPGTQVNRKNAVTITYTAGYLNDVDDPLPEEISESILKVCARLYEKRGDEDTGPVLSEEIINILDQVKVFSDANA